MDNKLFYEYVLSLLFEAGHVITPFPIYRNHTSNEALYIDSKEDVVLNRFDRGLLSLMDNVSLLADIKWPGVVDELDENVQIYSITVNFSNRCRSQSVADIHHLMQRYWNCTHSIVFFKHCEKYIVSFANNVCSHILSDWRNVGMDYDDIIDRICVGNISLTTSNEYFHDFLYAVAREYYIRPISFEEASYGLMPADYITKSLASDISFSKDEIKEIIQSNLVAFETVYGDDYVEPKYTGMEELNQHHNISAEIDRISFELELNSDIDDAQLEQFDFEEEGFEEDNDDDFFDGYDENVDPAIFDDPVLMVKWLEKKQKERDSETLKNQEQERLEAACREQERLDVARQEQERLDAARRERDLEAARQEQERIKTERAHLFSQLENTHLTKLKELESRYLAEKKRLHHELLQIEKGIQEKNNQLSKLSFLRFLERRSLTAGLEKLGQRKQKLLMLIQDIESMYNEQCNKERTEFSMILAEKGL
ncbi:hypothetical protein B5G34_07185 [Flavonifractor sp. An82]|uniref:hypothetical protein n=1 Tax=Flavonifractor sp. An82 TaxID=1965660 RepID=UPI000B39E470|nr:hypothetical protein [Flavonifractor sp. An82]OUN22237.1 hypothetical protein B5G34_07185 [Flavonifractor sp. An82]